MAAKVHFFTGKGGVGKSTLSASLAFSLAQKESKPVLVIDANGSGRVLKMLGISTDSVNVQKITPLDMHTQLYGVRINPKDSFREYFEQTLSKGASYFAHATSHLRDKIISSVVNNKIVSSFVDVCPGLEPTVLIGKIYHEALKGGWSHVVVDAPATGHGIMMFKSLFALTQIFQSGPVSSTSKKLKDFFLDDSILNIHIVSLINEHSLKEAQFILNETQNLGFKNIHLFFNRTLPYFKSFNFENLNPSWISTCESLKEDSTEQSKLKENFLKNNTISHTEIVETISESHSEQELVKTLALKLRGNSHD